MLKMNIEQLKQIIKENKVVVIKFYTEDCGVCKIYAEEFNKAEQEFKQIKFISININEKDEYIEFASNYGVFGVPTTLILKQGNIGELVTGFKNFQQLEIILKNYLN
jgi:thiol-disulfide isomerase/thioredoxin